MFYGNLVAYSYIPDKETISNLMDRGYTVILNTEKEIPEEIKSIKGIFFEKIEN